MCHQQRYGQYNQASICFMPINCSAKLWKLVKFYISVAFDVIPKSGASCKLECCCRDRLGCGDSPVNCCRNGRCGVVQCALVLQSMANAS